ncbi:type II toxin-antitoxin system VapC family toxin [Methanospirillum purgamenti]|uniref:type II toxin-antitoxin system VapC family toxin n=1 Tax=Methanospirillum purgamenti TaxID=2834276 RepID=UPI0021146135|nr:type II toxin-antitoxin system VapC family toxin [Methanospirillum hungatei]
MNLFFDTSALVKIFHNEEGSESIQNLILNEQNNLYILDIAQIEYYSALYRRYRNHELSKKNSLLPLQGLKRKWQIITFSQQHHR